MSETTKPLAGARNTEISGDNHIIKSSPVASPHLPSACLAPVHEETATVEQQQLQNVEEYSENRRPSFSPFYTLITDTTSSAIHHPLNVHYVFSDDDKDIVANACLVALPGSSSQTSSGISARSVSSSLDQSNTNNRQHKKNSPSSSRLPEHRTIIIDLDATGTQVTSAQSLSNAWQVLSTNITPAPTWNERPGGKEDDAAARYMLRVEGVNSKDWRQDNILKHKGKAIGANDFNALAEDFKAKMKMLSTIVDAGEKRFGVDLLDGEGDGGDTEESPSLDAVGDK